MLGVAFTVSAIATVALIKLPTELSSHLAAILLAIGGGVAAAVIWAETNIEPLDQ